MEIFRTNLRKGLMLGFIILMYSMSFMANDYLISILILICAYSVGMIGLQIITGYAGQISLGHAAFMGVGMYTVAIFEKHLLLNYWACLMFAGLIPMLIGMIFALPAVRIKGLYLAFASLAAHFIIVYTVSNWRSVTNGTDGLYMQRPQRLLGIDFSMDKNYYLLVLTVTIIMVYFAKNLMRTKLGRAFIAVRDNDIAAAVMGIHVPWTKMMAFGIGCFYAGISGALSGGYYEYVNIEWFTLSDSVWYLGFLVVGGVGSIFGAIAGAIVWKGLDEFSTLITVIGDYFLGAGVAGYATAAFGLIAYSMVVILVLVLEPRGLSHRWQIFKRSYRLHPFPY